MRTSWIVPFMLYCAIFGWNVSILVHNESDSPWATGMASGAGLAMVVLAFWAWGKTVDD